MAKQIETDKVRNRMSRAIGHIEAIRRMVEEERDCSVILIQRSTVRSARNVGKIIFKDHIRHCVVDAVGTGDEKTLYALDHAVDQFLR